MNKTIICFLLGVYSVTMFTSLRGQEFTLGASGYFRNKGVEVMAYDDIYPEGHQGGVSLIMHGNRVATNGDIRLEPTPGQWQPVPRQNRRDADMNANTITAWLTFPDSSRHMTGFNPMIYPDLTFHYKVNVRGEGSAVIVTVDLDRPVPEEFLGKVGFNLELFPGTLFGKPWIMDGQTGIFPQQPNGPTRLESSNHAHRGEFNPGGKASVELLSGTGYSPIIADDIVSEPYAVGKRFTVRPEDPYNRFTIESKGADLKLYDGRMNHNNGWFVLRSEVPAGRARGAIEWVITPNMVDDWLYEPVIQTSQIGYHPDQPKVAVIELDNRDTKRQMPVLYQITEEGRKKVLTNEGSEWGNFLRYNYLKFDFSAVKEEGLYQVSYGNSRSS
ncbi:MAG: cellulase N-terminal Ig-like domain-containing protein, partial [Proteiniphilum sp.]|nr:cellulase N-terminal Ig-like domain-containing protein [Proteiniphilum sp.]